MKLSARLVISAVVVSACMVYGQTQQAYEQDENPSSKGLLDPSRFTVHQAVSFGVSSGTSSDLRSQGLYSTMLQYKFAQPVTLNLNFGLPIFSTYSSTSNLNYDNIKSADYFKSMPYDISLTWKPLDNFLMRLSVSRRTWEDYYSGSAFPPYSNSLFGDW